MKTHSSFQIIGSIPTNGGGERRQFDRVLSALRDCVRRNLEFGVAVIHQNYHQPAKGKDKGWKGELDILLLCSDRIFVYDLKSGYTKILLRRTDERKWVVERAGNAHPQKSWFIQASRQRYFILRRYLESQRTRLGFRKEDHFVVDSRIVCEDGSDFSGFYHKVPNTLTPEMLDEILPHLSEDDQELILDTYAKPLYDTNELGIVRKLSAVQLEKIETAFRRADCPLKTERWFRILTESQLEDDLLRTQTERFRLSFEQARALAATLQRQSRQLEVSR